MIAYILYLRVKSWKHTFMVTVSNKIIASLINLNPVPEMDPQTPCGGEDGGVGGAA